MTTFSIASADRHDFLDTRASPSICSNEWLEKANWAPLKKIELATNMPPLRLSRHAVCALYGSRLEAKITDLKGEDHILKILADVLSSTAIPFLLGLTDQRRLGFDTCLREDHSRHLPVSSWPKIFSLMMTPHTWPRFFPLPRCSGTSLSWNGIVEKFKLHSSVAVTQAVTHTTACIVVADSQVLLDSSNAVYLIPPWRCSTWTPTVSRTELFRLHCAVKHPENSAMTNVSQKGLGDTIVPPQRRQKVEYTRCSD